MTGCIHIPAVNWIFISLYFISALARPLSTYGQKGSFNRLSAADYVRKLSGCLKQRVNRDGKRILHETCLNKKELKVGQDIILIKNCSAKNLVNNQ